MADTKEYKELFNQSGVPKRLIVSFPNLSVTLRNEDIVSESMEITESLCSQSELRFGSCEASVFKLRIIGNVIPLIGETCVVSMYAGDMDEPFVLGTYKVASDKPTADRKYRDIVAYDAMYRINTTDVAEWYNTILPTKDSTTTLREFRSSFVSHFGLVQEEVTLPNDNMTVTKTIEPEELSGSMVMEAIGEINGCFGHIGRDGKVKYIILQEFVGGVYPADDLFPSDDLFPFNGSGAEKISTGHYISCQYEDFDTKKIGKLQIRQEENDIGCIVGNGENCYIVENNFLVYGKGAAELEAIARKLLNVIKIVRYRPIKAKAVGNPCFEVGNGIRMLTQQRIVETYILERKLKGIQGLIDSYDARGVEKYSGKVNSVNRSILQLKGKMNILTRTVDETRSQLIDLDKGLSSQILQTAEEISAEVKRAQEAEASLSIRADEISISVSDLDKKLSSQITQTASEIALSVENLEESVQSDMQILSDQIQLSVTNLEKSMQSDIQVLSDQIQLRTTQGQVSSMISVALSEITITSSQIKLEGYTTINGGFKVFSDGSVAIGGGNTYASFYGNMFQIQTAGEGVLRMSSRFMAMYDNSFVETFVIAQLNGRKLSIGDGLCEVWCETINGGVPITSANIHEYI